MCGEPCIDGTRVPTGMISHQFMQSMSVAGIADDHGLTQVEVVQALRFEMRRKHDAAELARVDAAAITRIEEHLIAIRNKVGA